MLVLCSNGLSTPELQHALKVKMSDQKRAALVVTADNIYKERNYHVQRCLSELEQLGLQAETFDIDTQSVELLLDYDVVEFIGGNPFYLLQAIRRNACEAIIRELSVRKILIGWSAAAFVFGPSLGLAELYTPEMNFIGMEDLQGLSLTDMEVLPHYSKFLSRFDRFEERCREYEIRCNTSVLRMNDGQAVFLDGAEITYVG